MHFLGIGMAASTASAGILLESGIRHAHLLAQEVGIDLTAVSHNKRATQVPLLPYDGDVQPRVSRHTANLEIDSGDFFGIPWYSTNVALGTPNQPFRVILDLDYGGLFVRASHCGEPVGCGRGFEYVSNASSTHEDTNERFELHLPAQHVRGNVSTDHLQLVNLNVTNVTFGAVDEFYGVNFFYYALLGVADGAMGLAPPNDSSRVYTRTAVPNILSRTLTTSGIGRNIMSLTLPYKPGDRGSLCLGHLPEDVDDNFHRIPFTRSEFWEVGLSNISLINTRTSVAADIPLNDSFATFELGAGFAFPEQTAQRVWEALGIEKAKRYDRPILPCSRWDDMPALGLTLGNQEIKLPKEAYLASMYRGDGARVCFIDIVVNRHSNVSVLGVMMMREFHMVFDMEEHGLGLIPRN